MFIRHLKSSFFLSRHFLLERKTNVVLLRHQIEGSSYAKRASLHFVRWERVSHVTWVRNEKRFSPNKSVKSVVADRRHHHCRYVTPHRRATLLIIHLALVRLKVEGPFFLLFTPIFFGFCLNLSVVILFTSYSHKSRVNRRSGKFERMSSAIMTPQESFFVICRHNTVNDFV